MTTVNCLAEILVKADFHGNFWNTSHALYGFSVGNQFAALMLFLFWTEGAKEEELDAIEAQIGCKLPCDYRCSYRIHNGQKLVVPG